MSDVNRPVLVHLPFVEDDPNELGERCYDRLKKWKEWAVSTTPIPLSEEIIKDIHQILMTNLKTEDGIPVNAGSYRNIPIHFDDHAFPDHDCVRRNIKKIVDTYNSKASAPHDPYQLASRQIPAIKQ